MGRRPALFRYAPFYGFGLSECRFGDFLRGKPRGSYVLSTKVGRLFRRVPDNQVPDQAGERNSPVTILSQSFRKLG
jgi:aryl-alcohol dehydrogenase-like predicted oxidoreductase